MTDTMLYTHFAYFTREEDAERCKVELESDCPFVLIERVDATPPVLLRAGRNVSTETDWHAPIKDIVERHGGLYDYGEMGVMFLRAAVAAA